MRAKKQKNLKHFAQYKSKYIFRNAPKVIKKICRAL
jgi:hypothetical protein